MNAFASNPLHSHFALLHQAIQSIKSDPYANFVWYLPGWGKNNHQIKQNRHEQWALTTTYHVLLFTLLIVFFLWDFSFSLTLSLSVCLSIFLAKELWVLISVVKPATIIKRHIIFVIYTRSQWIAAWMCECVCLCVGPRRFILHNTCCVFFQFFVSFLLSFGWFYL